MNRKKLLLFILLIALAVAIGLSYVFMPRQKTVERLTFTPGSRPAPTRNAAAAPPRMDDKKLHLEVLDAPAARFAGFRRNIFQPIFHEELKRIPLPPPPPPPLAAKAPEPPALVGPPPPPPGLAAMPVEPPKPAETLGTFTFLGFVKKDNRKTIFLSKSNEIILVRKGDKIANKYEVTNITDEAMTLSGGADGREIIIPLEENRALTPARP
jgi:hypothetical protein